MVALAVDFDDPFGGFDEASVTVTLVDDALRRLGLLEGEKENEKHGISEPDQVTPFEPDSLTNR